MALRKDQFHEKPKISNRKMRLKTKSFVHVIFLHAHVVQGNWHGHRSSALDTVNSDAVIRKHTFCNGANTEMLRWILNKANLRDLITATGLVILFKLDSNSQFFSPCDLEVWWMISKNNSAPLLYYVKLCASFQIHRLIQSRFAVWKRSIWVKIAAFFPAWPCNFVDDLEKTIGHLFYTTLSFVHHFQSIGEFKLE